MKKFISLSLIALMLMSLCLFAGAEPVLINKITDENIVEIKDSAYAGNLYEEFELEFAGCWSDTSDEGTIASGAVRLDTEVKKYGEQSVRVESTISAGHSTFIIPVDASLLTPGANYTLQCWIKTESVVPVSIGANISVEFMTFANRINENVSDSISLDDVIVGTKDWKFASVSFKMPKADMDFLYLGFQVWDAKGVAWFDGIALIEGKPDRSIYDGEVVEDDVVVDDAVIDDVVTDIVDDVVVDDVATEVVTEVATEVATEVVTEVVTEAAAEVVEDEADEAADVVGEVVENVEDTEKSSNNIILIIGIIAGAVVIIGVVVFFLVKKKK